MVLSLDSFIGIPSATGGHGGFEPIGDPFGRRLVRWYIVLGVFISGLAVGLYWRAFGAAVVIHVGPHKTGSTTVQSELVNQASLLEVDG